MLESEPQSAEAAGDVPACTEARTVEEVEMEIARCAV